MPTKKAAASRPSLARKVTRATEEARKKALNEGVAITVDGDRYEVRIGDVQPSMSRDLRRATGFGTAGLMTAMTSKDVDIDIIQSFIWLARRIRGENVELDDCEFDYNILLDDKRFTLDEPDEEEEPDVPEA